MASVAVSEHGSTPDGRSVWAYALSNSAGVTVTILDFGATMVSVRCPSSTAAADEITLCFDDVSQLSDRAQNPYFGATVGRYANRIAGGRCKVDGIPVTLATNNGPNHLHGGVKGWDQQMWRVRDFGVRAGGKEAFVLLSLTSPDGDEGYPGDVEAFALYSLNDDNTIGMQFEARAGGSATPLNMCNHTYWALGGGELISGSAAASAGGSATTAPAAFRDIREQELAVFADAYVVANDVQIPTGELRHLAADPAFDFRPRVRAAGDDADAAAGAAVPAVRRKRIGEHLLSISAGGEPGYDHSFVIATGAGAAAASSSAGSAVSAADTDGYVPTSAPPAAMLTTAAALAPRYSVLPSTTLPQPSATAGAAGAGAGAGAGGPSGAAGGGSSSGGKLPSMADLFPMPSKAGGTHPDVDAAGGAGAGSDPFSSSPSLGLLAGMHIPAAPTAAPAPVSLLLNHLRPAVQLVDPASGRSMDVYTTQPCVHLYTGNFLPKPAEVAADTDASAGTGPGLSRTAKTQHHALCLETHMPPDSPNQPLCGSALLRPGQVYYHVTLHQLKW